MRSAMQRHVALVVVLVVAAALRVAAQIAYWPALFFTDSWSYLWSAYDGGLIEWPADRPVGYSLFLEGLALAGRSLAAITIVQHMLGLVGGILVYALLVRLRAPRWVAVAAAAITLFDAYLIALEQHVLAEAAFTVLVLASAYFLVAARDSVSALALSGALLSVAATFRLAAVFAIPVWLTFVVVRSRRRRLVLVGLVAVSLPLGLHVAAHRHETGQLDLTRSNGWFLYGRVATIADCSRFTPARQARVLCEEDPREGRTATAFYMWSPDSPAVRKFGPLGGDRHDEANEVLSGFAREVIRSRPFEYAKLVGGDFARFFIPGVGSGDFSDSAISFPERRDDAMVDPTLSRRYFPGLRLHVDRPAGALRVYADVVHTPRWLLAGLVVVALIAAVLSVPSRTRRHVRGTGDGLALVAMGVAMLVGSVVSSTFILRYLVPSAPLILCGGALILVAVYRNVRPSPVRSVAGHDPS